MRSGLAALLLLATLVPAAARAQAPGADVSMVESRARSLFERAIEELREGHAAAGRDLLRRSLAILPTVATRYNLAVALRRTGEVTEAQFLLQRLLAEELTEAQRARVQEQLDSIDDQIATLEIRVRGGAAPASVEIDGIEVGEVDDAAPLRVSVDPGRHRVAALSGNLRGTADAELDRGQTRRVELSLAPFVEPGAPGPDPWPWVIAALAVVAAGAAVGITLWLTIGQPDDPYPTARTFETLTAVRF